MWRTLPLSAEFKMCKHLYTTLLYRTVQNSSMLCNPEYCFPSPPGAYTSRLIALSCSCHSVPFITVRGWSLSPLLQGPRASDSGALSLLETVALSVVYSVVFCSFSCPSGEYAPPLCCRVLEPQSPAAPPPQRHVLLPVWAKPKT